MKLTYTQVGDYFIPNLYVPKTVGSYGKFGMLRKTYLKENKEGLYTAMLMEGTLHQHLMETDEAAQNRLDQLIQQQAEALNVTEQMKQENPMLWVGMMNNIRHSAEEIILSELIYVQKINQNKRYTTS